MLEENGNLLFALELARDASRVKRFHTVSTIKENTVGQHTSNVIGLLLLCIPPTALRHQLLAAAWQHDVPEAEIGDIPSPFKRELRDEGIDIDCLERDVLRGHYMHAMENYLHAYEVVWLKTADIMEGWMFCLDEMSMGNRRIEEAALNFYNYAEKAMKGVRNMAVNETVSEKDLSTVKDRFQEVYDSLEETFNNLRSE